MGHAKHTSLSFMTRRAFLHLFSTGTLGVVLSLLGLSQKKTTDTVTLTVTDSNGVKWMQSVDFSVYDPYDYSTIYASNTEGLWMTKDAGYTWTKIGDAYVTDTPPTIAYFSKAQS